VALGVTMDPMDPALYSGRSNAISTSWKSVKKLPGAPKQNKRFEELLHGDTHIWLCRRDDTSARRRLPDNRWVTSEAEENRKLES